MLFTPAETKVVVVGGGTMGAGFAGPQGVVPGAIMAVAFKGLSELENLIRTDHDVKIGKIKFNEGEAVGIGQIIIDFVQS